MTIAEIDPEVLIEREIAEAEARGEDPYADKAGTPAADAEPQAAAEEKPEPTPEVKAEPAEQKADPLDMEALAAIAGEPEQNAEPEVAQVEVAQQPAYRAEVPSDLDTKRAALMTEKAEALEKLMSGEIDAKEYAKVDAKVTTDLDTLSRAQSKAEALADINQQTAANQQGQVISQIIRDTKEVLDYSKDAKAQRQFDTAMQMLAADPDNASKAYAELANEANRSVLALRGLLMPAKPDARGKPAPKRDVPATPVTLSGLPSAATTGSKSTNEVLGSLKGEDFEKAYDTLTTEERARLLR